MFENYTPKKKSKCVSSFVFLTKKFFEKRHQYILKTFFKCNEGNKKKTLVKHSCLIKIQSLYNLVKSLSKFSI